LAVGSSDYYDHYYNENVGTTLVDTRVGEIKGYGYPSPQPDWQNPIMTPHSGTGPIPFYFLHIDNTDGAFQKGDYVKVELQKIINATVVNVDLYTTIDDIVLNTSSPSPSHIVHFADPAPLDVNEPGFSINLNDPNWPKIILLAKKELPADDPEKTPIRPFRLRADYGLPSTCPTGQELPASGSSYAEECLQSVAVSFWGLYAPYALSPGSSTDALVQPVNNGTLNDNMGTEDVKLVWEIWDAHHTAMLQSSSKYLDDLQGETWKYFSFDIPVLRKGVDRLLDVYIENNMLSDGTTTQKRIFIDDLMVHPTGAKASARST